MLSNISCGSISLSHDLPKRRIVNSKSENTVLSKKSPLMDNLGMKIESFYYWNTLNFLITQVFVSQSEVYYKVERLLTDRENLYY